MPPAICSWVSGIDTEAPEFDYKNYQHAIPYESLKCILDAGMISSHLHAYLHTRPDYLAVKVAFMEAAMVEPPFWVKSQDIVVYQGHENWRQFLKLLKFAQGDRHGVFLKQNTVAAMIDCKLLRLRDEL